MWVSLSQVSCSNSGTVTPSSGSYSLLSPVGSINRRKSLTHNSLCSESTTSSISPLTSKYPRALGFEREDQVHILLSTASGPMQHTDSVGPDTHCIIVTYKKKIVLLIFPSLFALHFSFITESMSHELFWGLTVRSHQKQSKFFASHYCRKFGLTNIRPFTL